MVLVAPALIVMPLLPLAIAADPAAFVPMKLPATVLAVVPAPAMLTPDWLLPEMTLRAAAVVPPTVLLVVPALRTTPLLPLKSPADPAALTPMKLPATVLPVVPAALMLTPGPVLPEMRLPAPAVVPPMVLLLAPPVTTTPANPLGIRAVPVALLPMKLPDTTFPVAAIPPMMTPWDVLPEITFRSAAVAPPITLFGDEMNTPCSRLPRAAVPLVLVPMKLASSLWPPAPLSTIPT